MEEFIGTIAGEDESVEEPIGVFAVPGMGWLVRNLRDRRGPCLSRELGENGLTRIYTTDPGLVENWLEVARIVGGGLLCTSIMLAGALLLTSVVCMVGWWLRLL